MIGVEVSCSKGGRIRPLFLGEFLDYSPYPGFWIKFGLLLHSLSIIGK